MDKFYLILELILKNPLSEDMNSVSGMIDGNKVTVNRRLVIDSQTLLPTMDLTIRVNDEYAGYGMSGGFMIPEDMVKVNKYFIDIKTAMFDAQTKRQEEAKEILSNIK